MKPARSFASDNNAGVHPQVLKAITAANHGHVVGYGDDPYTSSAIAKFKEHFGRDVDVFFVFNGTAANVLSLSALAHSYEAVICTEAAHIHNDECAAPEKFVGSKLIPLVAPDGKLTVELVNSAYHGVGDQHHVQPKVISVTQATEMGTVYQPEELKALTRFAHEHKMFVHMDGARLANAAVSLGQTLRQATRDLGIDALSFGGTKNGLMGGEAVVFFNRSLAENFQFVRKQGMQLASKMRFIAAQFEALLSNDLWRKSAQHANRMAKFLEREIRRIPQVEIVYPVEANGVFARVPRRSIRKLQQRYFFYVWNEEQSVVRWMCSFDTTEEDIRSFVRFVAATVGTAA
jgi:threonine aldolase